MTDVAAEAAKTSLPPDPTQVRIHPLTVARAAEGLRLVVELGTFTAAAERLGVSPHTLSVYSKRFPGLLQEYLNAKRNEASISLAEGLVAHLNHLKEDAVVKASTPTESTRVVQVLAPHLLGSPQAAGTNPGANPDGTVTADELIVVLRRMQWKERLPEHVRAAIDARDVALNGEHDPQPADIVEGVGHLVDVAEGASDSSLTQDLGPYTPVQIRAPGLSAGGQ